MLVAIRQKNIVIWKAAQLFIPILHIMLNTQQRRQEDLSKRAHETVARRAMNPVCDEGQKSRFIISTTLVQYPTQSSQPIERINLPRRAIARLLPNTLVSFFQLLRSNSQHMICQSLRSSSVLFKFMRSVCELVDFEF
ncbi:hypothetical protein KCU99_g280, partial [Aureobasidium melanogenum]